MPSIKLNITAGVTIEIQPQDYLLQPLDEDFTCLIQIGTHSTSTSFRLGTQFFKSLFLVFDYDNNNIMVGSKSDHTFVNGDESLIYVEPVEKEEEKEDEEKEDDEKHDDDADQKVPVKPDHHD